MNVDPIGSAEGIARAKTSKAGSSGKLDDRPQECNEHRNSSHSASLLQQGARLASMHVWLASYRLEEARAAHLAASRICCAAACEIGLSLLRRVPL